MKNFKIAQLVYVWSIDAYTKETMHGIGIVLSRDKQVYNIYVNGKVDSFHDTWLLDLETVIKHNATANTAL